MTLGTHLAIDDVQVAQWIVPVHFAGGALAALVARLSICPSTLPACKQVPICQLRSACLGQRRNASVPWRRELP